MRAFLAPWTLVDATQAAALDAVLARELGADHPLAGRAVLAIARRVDNDDVLFEVEGLGFAVVHLTFTRSPPTSPQWPATQLFASFEDWTERGMKPDHADYAGDESSTSGGPDPER